MATSPSFLFLLFYSLILFIPQTQALPLENRSQFTAWLASIVLPERGTSISSEIKCYGLPYGGIGNASHVLTYWTLGCIFFYRRPWCPWSPLRAGKFDIWLGIVQVVVSAGIAGLTISRCRNRWQFILLAAARLQFSLTLGYAAIVTSVRVMYTVRNEYERVDKPMYERLSSLPWLVHLSALPGLAALISLVYELWQSCRCESADSCQVCEGWTLKFHGQVPPIQIISWAFLGPIAIMLVIMAFCLGRRREYKRVGGEASGQYRFHLIGGILSLLLALYTDWLLAILADNLTGAPSGDLAVLYWVGILCFERDSDLDCNAGIFRSQATANAILLITPRSRCGSSRMRNQAASEKTDDPHNSFNTSGRMISAGKLARAPCFPSCALARSSYQASSFRVPPKLRMPIGMRLSNALFTSLQAE